MAAMSPEGMQDAVAAFARRFRGIPLPAIGLAGIATLVVLNLIPVNQPIEGVLEAKSVTFKTDEDGDGSERIFLNEQVASISLSALNINGNAGVLPVQLAGKIDGASKQGVSLKQLESLDFLPLQLGNGDILRLGTSAAGTARIGIKLVLPPGTRVRDLNYNDDTSILAFGIVPASGGEKPTLQITPQEPVQVRISSARALPSIPLPSSGEVSLRLDTSEFPVPIKAPATLRLKLSSPPGINMFPQRLDVSDVSFEEEYRPSFDEVPIIQSTLKGGTVHLGQQEVLNLRPDQSLIIKPPGIKELNFLRVTLPQKGESSTAKADQSSPMGTASLTVGVIGNSHEISAGLSKSHPINYRGGSLLSRLLNPAQLNAVNGFLGGIASALVLSFFKK
jgi:hypothetical protein